jgi:hemolysin III
MTQDLLDRHLIAPDRPRLRGRLHLVAAFASIVGLVWLVRSAGSPRAEIAAWIYGVAAVLLYGTSASYHVFTRSPRSRRLMQRADHSMIFVLIAGTFTPMCILAIGGPWRWVLLGCVWAAAVAGMIIKILALDRFPRLGNGLYIAIGWAGLSAMPSLIHRPGLLALIVAAGVLYTGGALLFSMKRPRLSVHWFGYHEMWHSVVVVAGILLYIANFGLIRAG